VSGVLFACRENAARSQLAEALFRQLAPRHEAWSAGSAPSHVHPEVRPVLEEAGFDARGLRSKGFAEVPWREVDLVVLLCTEEACPLPPAGPAVLHWPQPDPAAAPPGERLEAFRATRDEILRRLPDLVERLDRLDGRPPAA